MSEVNVKSNIKSLRLVRVTEDTQRALFTSIVKNYHSYVPQSVTVGRQINYLVELDGKTIGCIGMAQAPNFPSRTMLHYFRLRNMGNAYKPKWLELLPHIGNNWRFTLTPEAPKNAASRILSVFTVIGAKDWKERYGDELKWVVTYLGPGKTGAAYKACGWKYIGHSAGVLMEKRGYSQFKNIKATVDPNARKAILLKAVKPEYELFESVYSGESGKPTQRVTGPPEEGTSALTVDPQAVVEQSSSAPVQGVDGVHNDPTAPLTILASSETQLSPTSSAEKPKIRKYRMIKRDGKNSLKRIKDPRGVQ